MRNATKETPKYLRVQEPGNASMLELLTVGPYKKLQPILNPP